MSWEEYLREGFDKIEEKNLGNAEKVIAYANLGIKCKHDNRYNDALVCYKKALEIDPRQGMVYYNMGKILSILDKDKEAARAYYLAYIYNAPCMKTLCLLTSNKDHSLDGERIGELIANEVGKVHSTSILISMILTKSKHLDNKGKIFPISMRYYPHKKRMEVYEKPENPFSSFIMANKQIPMSEESDPYTDNNAGKYITGKQYIDARENVYESNLAFIFS